MPQGQVNSATSGAPVLVVVAALCIAALALIASQQQDSLYFARDSGVDQRPSKRHVWSAAVGISVAMHTQVHVGHRLLPAAACSPQAAYKKYTAQTAVGLSDAVVSNHHQQRAARQRHSWLVVAGSNSKAAA